MPHASTSTRTCPAFGSGISRSTNSQSPPGLLICAAFIFVFMIASLFINQLVGGCLRVFLRSISIHIDHGLGKVLWRFLRQIVPDAAFDDAVCIFA